MNLDLVPKPVTLMRIFSHASHQFSHNSVSNLHRYVSGHGSFSSLAIHFQAVQLATYTQVHASLQTLTDIIVMYNMLMTCNTTTSKHSQFCMRLSCLVECHMHAISIQLECIIVLIFMHNNILNQPLYTLAVLNGTKLFIRVSHICVFHSLRICDTQNDIVLIYKKTTFLISLCIPMCCVQLTRLCILSSKPLQP